MSYSKTKLIDRGQDGRHVAFSPEKGYNRQCVQGRHDDIDEYPCETRKKHILMNCVDNRLSKPRPALFQKTLAQRTKSATVNAVLYRFTMTMNHVDKARVIRLT
jgi:hypothetical protein